MADLSDLQAAQTVKIAGASIGGGETTFVNATLNGEVKSADFLNAAVTQGILTVGTGASVEVLTSGARLVNRKSIQIQAQGTNLSYGFTASTQPFTIANGTTIVISVGDNIGVWLRRSSGLGTVTVAYAEFA